MIPGDKAYYPGTDVLANRFGIRDGALLQKMEYRLVNVREMQVRAAPIEGQFDLAHLQKIHRHLFQDVYEWAGQLREIDFAKRGQSNNRVTQFMPIVVLDIKAEELGRYLAERNQLKGLTKPEFVKALTEVHTRLNELHPFREGNGRTTRVFLSQLAKEAGYELDLTKIEKTRWNQASQAALNTIDPKNPQLPPVLGNQGDMRQIFHEAVRPTLAHAFKTETREAAIKHYPELEKAYARLDAIGKFVSALPSREGRDLGQVLEAERTRIVKKLENDVIPPLNAYLQGRFASPETARAVVQQLANPLSAKAVAKATRGLRM